MPINGFGCHISDLLSFRTDVAAAVFFYANLGTKTSRTPLRRKGDNTLSKCLRATMDVNIFEPFSAFISLGLVTAGRGHLAGRHHGWNMSHDAGGLK